MNDANIAIIFVTATTISLTPVQVAEIQLFGSNMDVLATAGLNDYCAHAATVITQGQAAEAVIKVETICQPLSPPLANPCFAYDESGRLIMIDYDGPNHKFFVYDNDRLVMTELFDGPITRRKHFIYDAGGALTRIIES